MPFISTRRGAQSRLWTPKDLGVNLNFWIDGTDLATQTISGSKILGWFDKSLYFNNLGNGNSGTQPLNLNPPAVQNTVGLLQTSNAPLIPVGTSDRSVIFVDSMYSGRNGVNQYPFFWGTNSGTSAFGFYAHTNGAGSTLGDATSFNYQVYNGSSSVGPAAGVYPAVYNTTQMISVMASNQTVTINGNGSQVYTGAFSYNTATASLYVFNNSADNSALQGSLFDLLILNTANPSLVAKVEGWLAWKRGLVSSLPASHQYKRQPPRLAG